MWFKFAQQKFNLFGLPITGKPKIKKFTTDEDQIINIPVSEDDDSSVDVADEIIQPEEEIVNIDDPTPQDEFTPEDLQTNIQILENDPTVNFVLPPYVHENCRCQIKTVPVLSQLGVNDGRRIWQMAENCCEICRTTAEAFNQAEIQRLLNKGIDINIISG